jgi:hypothetical protein
VLELDLLTVTAADGRDLLFAAQSDWSRPVQDCPGWTAADLVGPHHQQYQLPQRLI